MTSLNVYSAFVFSTNNITIVILNNYLYLSPTLTTLSPHQYSSIFINKSITNTIDKLNEDLPYSTKRHRVSSTSLRFAYSSLLLSPRRGGRLYTSRKREREDYWEADGIATHARRRISNGEPLIKIFRSEGTNLASLKWGETAVEVRASNVSLGTDWPNYERKRLAHSSSRISSAVGALPAFLCKIGNRSLFIALFR